MFNASNGHRQFVPKIVMMITNNNQSDADISDARYLRSEGTKILTIDMGSYTSMTQLLDVAGDMFHVIRVTHFKDLPNQHRTVLDRYCQGIVKLG